MDLMLWYESLIVQFRECRVALVREGFAYWFTLVKYDKMSESL